MHLTLNFRLFTLTFCFLDPTLLGLGLYYAHSYEVLSEDVWKNAYRVRLMLVFIHISVVRFTEVIEKE